MQHKVVAAQNISRMCVVCGEENDFGLHTRFFELDSGELLGVFEPAEHHQSYPGRLHGGIASTLLDETIGRAISITDKDAWGVTVELTVRFRKPVPLDSEVRARRAHHARLSAAVRRYRRDRACRRHRRGRGERQVHEDADRRDRRRRLRRRVVRRRARAPGDASSSSATRTGARADSPPASSRNRNLSLDRISTLLGHRQWCRA